MSTYNFHTHFRPISPLSLTGTKLKSISIPVNTIRSFPSLILSPIWVSIITHTHLTHHIIGLQQNIVHTYHFKFEIQHNLDLKNPHTNRQIQVMKIYFKQV